jgi:peroxiredoxin
MRRLADYRGQVILLNFWATWCEPCKVEMPSMEAVHRDFARHGLRVVAVSEDNPAQVSPADLRDYADDLGLTFDILRDTSGAMTKSYQIIGYPTTFVIARDGTVRRRWVGPEDWNSPANRALIRSLLGLEDRRS